MRQRKGESREEYLKRVSDYNKKKNSYKITTLYYLPEHHYIGMTKQNLKKRIARHRCDNGMIIDRCEIIFQHKDPLVVAYLEAKLHMMGYNGSRWQGTRNYR